MIDFQNESILIPFGLASGYGLLLLLLLLLSTTVLWLSGIGP